MTSLEEQLLELRDLPARVAGVERQILQLQDEMREAFSASQADLTGGLEGLRGEIQGSRDELRTEMHQIRDELRGEIRAGNEETRNFMRALHEEALTRIATIGEGHRRGASDDASRWPHVGRKDDLGRTTGLWVAAGQAISIAQRGHPDQDDRERRG